MRLKYSGTLGNILLALLLMCAVQLSSAQVVRSAEQGGLPLRVGVGVSSYYTEIWPHSRQTGPAIWGDWTLSHVPSVLRGLGVEAEARGLLWGQQQGSSWDFATIGGGPIYSYKRSKSIQPYAKFILNYGTQWNIKGGSFPSRYHSDKWLTYAPGGGVDVHAVGRVWVRADYEYQYWKTDWFNTTDNLNPQGFTLGVAYDLRPRAGR
jgi:hypothetical protein